MVRAPHPIQSTRQPKCWTESVVYRVECVPCAEHGVKSWYIGESSCSGYERGAEHLGKSLTSQESFYMTKHGWEEHGLDQETTPMFRMVIVRCFQKAMERQIAQAVMIEMAKPDHLLNSKSEWGFPRIPRLRVEFGDSLMGDPTPQATKPPATTETIRKRRVPPTSGPDPPNRRLKRSKTSPNQRDSKEMKEKNTRTRKTVSFNLEANITHHYDYQCGGQCSYRTNIKNALWAHEAQHAWMKVESEEDFVISLDPPYLMRLPQTQLRLRPMSPPHNPPQPPHQQHAPPQAPPPTPPPPPHPKGSGSHRRTRPARSWLDWSPHRPWGCMGLWPWTGSRESHLPEVGGGHAPDL